MPQTKESNRFPVWRYLYLALVLLLIHFPPLIPRSISANFPWLERFSFCLKELGSCIDHTKPRRQIKLHLYTHTHILTVSASLARSAAQCRSRHLVYTFLLAGVSAGRRFACRRGFPDPLSQLGRAPFIGLTKSCSASASPCLRGFVHVFARPRWRCNASFLLGASSFLLLHICRARASGSLYSCNLNDTCYCC
jgi:hypothetical protein